MTNEAQRVDCRLFFRWWIVTLALLLTVLAWDLAGLDLWLMRQLADGLQGFAWRSQPVLERVFHDRARQVAVAAYVVLMGVTVFPIGPWRGLGRMERASLASGVSLALLAVNAVKRNSLTSCPWDLLEFGGVARYVSHWSWGLVDGGPGRCFPGGHASAALAFLPIAVALLLSTSARQRRQGGWWLASVLTLGLVLGAVQTVRGAHYPSHTLWTVLICWTVALLNHHACLVVQRLYQAWQHHLPAKKRPGTGHVAGLPAASQPKA